MKKPAIIALALACVLPSGLSAQVDADPTRTSPKLRAALLEGGTAIPELTAKGLVMAAGREGGAVVLEATGGGRVLARPRLPFTLTVDGVPRKLVVKAISAEGIEVEAPDHGQTVTLPGPGPAVGGRAAPAAEVAYVEFRELPLLDALRLLSDQTGHNFSASAEANKIPVNSLLRNVPADAVVEELCKSHNLWFKTDERTGITRIMTVGEFEKDLAGFREERTEVFTLKYPNVSEIAVAVADLFGDRVEFSLGADETDDDMRRDLEGRFDRFDVLTQRTQQAAYSQTFGNNYIGGNAGGFFSNGSAGTYGFGGFGGGGFQSGDSRFGDDSRRSRLDRRRTDRSDGAAGADDAQFSGLTPGQAQRVDQALSDRGAGAAAVEGLRKKQATIFVTGSRRNNMLVVRTADTRAMDDIRSLVRSMDVPTALVLLEVKVLSVELGTDFRSAFDYQFSDGNTSGSFTRENLPVPLDNGEILAGGLNSSDMTFVLVNDNFRARMQLFEQKNRVKTVATPTLLTANNEVSRLFLGEERPIVRGINSQTVITDNNVATTPNTTTEFRPVGNTLLITPNINSDRTVTLRLVQENSFINANGANIPVVTNGAGATTAVQQVPVDVVASRSISGTFVAKDSMAVAAGGLIEDIDSTKRGQIPLLGSIPGLGTFFRREEVVKSRRELVIVIKPHVMSTPADGQRLSEEVLRQLAPASVDRLSEEGFLPGGSLFPTGAATAPAAKNTKKTVPSH